MRHGDRLARLVWQRYVNRVARGLSLVVNALDPDIFVMGGGMSNVDELYTDLPPELASYTFSTVFETPIQSGAWGFQWRTGCRLAVEGKLTPSLCSLVAAILKIYGPFIIAGTFRFCL